MKKLLPVNWVTFSQLLLGATLAILIGYLFRINIHDIMQHDSDAWYFFDVASNGGYVTIFDESMLTKENLLPILIWEWIYRLMSHFGVAPDPFFGILLNSGIVVVTQFMVILYAKRVYSYDRKTLISFSLLMSLNGVLMMFAGIHIRDSFLLLITAISVIAFHPKRAGGVISYFISKIWLLLLLMVAAFLCRVEGFIAPLMIYNISIVVSTQNKGRGRVFKNSILFLTGTLALILILIWFDVFDLVIENYKAYKLLTQNESKADSLAYLLLYELPFPLSTVASSALLLFIKIPFWRNFFLDSYSFFISLASLQMLWVAPAFLTTCLYMLFHKVDYGYKYLLYVILFILIATAVTSNQVRHFATMYPFLLLVYQSRDKIIINDRRSHYKYIQYGIFASALLLSIFSELR